MTELNSVTSAANLSGVLCNIKKWMCTGSFMTQKESVSHVSVKVNNWGYYFVNQQGLIRTV